MLGWQKLKESSRKSLSTQTVEQEKERTESKKKTMGSRHTGNNSRFIFSWCFFLLRVFLFYGTLLNKKINQKTALAGVWSTFEVFNES